MKIDLPVIGIPPWPWKRKLIDFAVLHPRAFYIENKQLDYECGRHYEFLKVLDSGGDIMSTEYVRFLRYLGNYPASVFDKVAGFEKLYVSIKKHGLLPDKLPIITLDGVRLNGSHRISIAVHLGIEKIWVNIANYKDVFSPKEMVSIKAQVQECRKMKLQSNYLETHRY